MHPPASVAAVRKEPTRVEREELELRFRADILELSTEEWALTKDGANLEFTRHVHFGAQGGRAG